MSTDDAYSDFLDKANQDTSASKASMQSKTANTKAVDTEVPVALKSVEKYYTSEADEPFEAVSLKWDGKNMPSESMHSPALIAAYTSDPLLIPHVNRRVQRTGWARIWCLDPERPRI